VEIGASPMIQMNDFKRQWSVIGSDVLSAVARVGSSGRYILGREVEGFEASLAAQWGVAYAVGAANGLEALELALRCVGIRHGDRVLTTPLSAFATTLAIIHVGAVPVFCDVDGTGLVDLERCRAAIGKDPGISCLVPVHLYGHSLDMEALRALRCEFELRIVEDCAQSIGASFRGIATGTAGQVAATSFYPTKNLGALGDAGALLTDTAGIAELARSLRHYGQTATYVHENVGLNSRLDEIHAAILRDALLPRLSGWNSRRQEIAARYRSSIANPRVDVPPLPAGSASVWHLFPVLVESSERARFVEHLRRAGVQTGAHYPVLIPGQKALQAYGRFEVIDDLGNAARFSEGEVSLPIHPFLTDAEVETVVDACNRWREG
jgi:dTDP-4-amino-4,6-dideoxygalactose transaminase